MLGLERFKCFAEFTHPCWNNLVKLFGKRSEHFNQTWGSSPLASHVGLAKTDLVVIANDKEPTEAAGIEFCKALFKGGRWIKTSYNATIRKNFAGKGYVYDQYRDAFIAPKRFPSFVFNEDTCQWDAPVAKPDDGKLYRWDEITTSWIALS